MLNIHLPYNPAVPILGSIYAKEMNTYALTGKGNTRDTCGDRNVALT